MSRRAQPVRGFFGKLPSRWDFVSHGLPRSFTDPWAGWLQSCLPESRRQLGADWPICWLEAPVWRFALAPGLCGPEAVLGIWVPSVDRNGRDFPLTVASLAAEPARLLDDGAEWLDLAEDAACEAVLETAEPDELAAALGHTPGAARGYDTGTLASWGRSGGLWWTAGAPRVEPTRLAIADLPSSRIFASMVHTIEETA
jgi:type VI secretion system protein ImpM